MTTSRWLNVDETAELLGVSPKRLYELTAARQVPFHRIGRRIRFTPSDLAEIEKSTALVPATPLRLSRTA
jgi:excisionase family DNA binding protein